MATEAITIAPWNLREVIFHIKGNAPFVQAKFSLKARAMMRDKMLAGSTAAKGTKRSARDFDDDYQQAQHISTDGWNGIPAPAFRQALISACRVCGFAMTKAKLSVFVIQDGIDADGTPLVRIFGDHEPLESTERNATGVADIRVRPIWKEWSAKVHVRFDADQFTLSDVSNLMARAGLQVGIGEGRPDSKSSTGQGWGTFDIVEVLNVGGK